MQVFVFVVEQLLVRLVHHVLQIWLGFVVSGGHPRLGRGVHSGRRNEEKAMPSVTLGCSELGVRRAIQ